MKHRFSQRGITLLETIISISIFMVAVVIVAQYIITGYNSNRFALEQGDAIEHAKRGIDAMIKEIRESSFAENGDYPLVVAEDQNFAFYSDIDSDQAIERVRYYLDGTDLIKGVVEPSNDIPPVYDTGTEATTTISQYIQNGSNPMFYYYNGDYPDDMVNNPLSTPPNLNEVRLIKLLLEVNIDPTKAPTDFVLEVFAQLRNLKDNL